tara:strand:- start:177 stop:359 length:183 start_codon:yes stop_codon:yes gene_type:complete
MIFDLVLDSGLEVEFTTDFKSQNKSIMEQATWILPEPSSTTNTLLLDPEHFFIDEIDEEN